MKFITQAEIDDLIAAKKGSQLAELARIFNELRTAGVDMTVNQFRATYSDLPTFKDDRGDVRICSGIYTDRAGDTK